MRRGHTIWQVDIEERRIVGRPARRRDLQDPDVIDGALGWDEGGILPEAHQERVTDNIGIGRRRYIDRVTDLSLAAPRGTDGAVVGADDIEDLLTEFTARVEPALDDLDPVEIGFS